MRTAVIYCSQTGFTEKYARWIAEEQRCEATPFAQRGAVDLGACDAVVFCSWFHAASMKGVKWIKAQIAQHPEVRFAILASGASPAPCSNWPAEGLEEAFCRSFPAEEYADLPWFYCQGGFDFERLGLPDRLAMRAFFRMMEGKAKESPRDAEALASMRAGFDATSRNALEPLFAHLRAIEQPLTSGS